MSRVRLPGDHGRSRARPPVGPSRPEDPPRLCFDSRLLTALVFRARDAGLLRPLGHPPFRELAVRLLSHVHVGSDRFAVVVEGTAAAGSTTTASFTGRGQSRATGLTAAAAARLLRTGRIPAGVHHLEQLVLPAAFLDRLASDVQDSWSSPDGTRRRPVGSAR